MLERGGLELGVFSFGKRKTEDANQLHSLLELAKSGDSEARGQFIQAYVPYILRTASQASRRYIDRTRDDEYSVALLAFNEAIDRFDASRSSGFLSFAETIIRRRLIDYFRSQKSQQRVQPFADFDVQDDEDNTINYVEIRASVASYQEALETDERRQEIEDYARRLKRFGLRFQELVELSPKHADARQNAMDVARIIAADPSLLAFVMERQSLPLKALEARVGVSRKTMERQRKYIIAIVVLLTGDYLHLKSYIEPSQSEAVESHT